MHKEFSFDEAYYQRYYNDASSRVESDAEIAARGAYVCAYLKYLRQPVNSVVDLGCGLGHWREVLHQHFPKASYQGVELSKYLCQRYGWQHSSIDKFKSAKMYDLVICQDVLQYLSKSAVAKAIKNFDDLCRGVLYLQVMTKTDWEDNCDQDFSDGDGYLRSAKWYRQRLSKYFTNLGGGCFVSRKSKIVFYDLEAAV